MRNGAPFGRGIRPSAHDVREAVAASLSLREALRRLGRADSEIGRAHV